jgi:hypothetical protein
MSELRTNYEQKRQRIITRRTEEDYLLADALTDDELDGLSSSRKKVDYLDVAKIGTGVLVGGGVGLLAGVATIAVAAGAAEIIVGGVITKVAGVVGGAAGFGWGLKSIEKKNQ